MNLEELSLKWLEATQVESPVGNRGSLLRAEMVWGACCVGAGGYCQAKNYPSENWQRQSVHPRFSGVVSAVGLLDPTEPAFQSVEFSLDGEL